MTILEEMIKQYKPETSEESKAALREILQSIVLVGLSRGVFLINHRFMEIIIINVYLIPNSSHISL
jgi:hypothetical protein